MDKIEFFLAGIDIEKDEIKQYLCTNIDENKKAFVCDRYDPSKSLIIKRMGKNILTGNENWRFDKETKTFVYYQENKHNENGCGKFDKMMSNYFKWQPYNIEVPYSHFQGNDKGEIMFKFKDGITDIEVFKKWLKEKWEENCPVEVHYILQYPIILKTNKVYNLDNLKMYSGEYSSETIIKRIFSEQGVRPKWDRKESYFRRKE